MFMISSMNALLLGLVEGITEFLPVSSTAHLVITNALLGNTLNASSVQTLEIAIQGGAILAVLVFFYKEFFSKVIFTRVLLGTVPALCIAFLLKDVAEKFLSNMHVIAWALILGGCVLILIEQWTKSQKRNIKNEMSTRDAVLMGLSQSLALIPGVSRSGASIVTGLLLGNSRETIVTYSFFLAVPLLGAASLYSLLKHPETITDTALFIPFLVGSVVAFVSSLLVIKYLLIFVRTYSFVPFGVYRIILGICLLLLY
ncbi:MAG: undecaprenyl-diphosphate phosphatase [Minisyncoccia bacterium]